MAKSVKEKYPEVKDIKQGIGTAKEGAVELAKHVKDDGVQQFEQTTETIKNQYQTEMARVESHVRTNPLQSIAVAFAGGLIASMILRSRR